MSEALLPDTDAITDNTLEWVPYRGKWLVRFKDARGYTHRCQTANYQEADEAFEKFKARMKEEAARSRL